LECVRASVSVHLSLHRLHLCVCIGSTVVAAAAPATPAAAAALFDSARVAYEVQGLVAKESPAFDNRVTACFESALRCGQLTCDLLTGQRGHRATGAGYQT